MNGAYLTVTATGVTLASGAVSTSTAIPNASTGLPPNYIRIAATQPSCIRIGVGPQSAATTDLQVQPGDAVTLQLPRGITTIACVAATATAGIVQVSPIENS